MFSRSKSYRSLLLPFSLLFTLQCDLIAQPSMNYLSAHVEWPTVTLYTQVSCGTSYQMHLTKENFEIVESGVPISNFLVIAADTNIRRGVSVVFAVDRSGSTSWGSPSAMDGMRKAVKTFVDLMDSTLDEAALISFSHRVSIDVAMTSNKSLLKQSVDTLTPGGATDIHLATWTSEEHVRTSASRSIKAVILFTDGDEQGLGFDIILDTAIARNIHIFTIGLGTGINDADLLYFATETGGKYFRSPSPYDLTEQMKEIFRRILNDSYQLVLKYQTSCMDGAWRKVTCSVKNISGCSGSTSKTNSFKTEKDTTTFETLSTALQVPRANPFSFVEIPVRLVTPMNGVFQKASFQLKFDSTCMQYDNTYVDGTLLQGVNLSATPIKGGVEVSTDRPVVISDSGLLMKLVFRTLSRGSSSSRTCPLKIENWMFQKGCFSMKDASSSVILNVSSPEQRPENFVLQQNFPNPFSDRTTIELQIPDDGLQTAEIRNPQSVISFKVFDIFGREVLDLTNEAVHNSQFSIHHSQLPRPGAYFYRLFNGVHSQTKTMHLVR